jgi:hypothetical protein
MGLEKIAAYYDDPIKQAYDAFCTTKAFGLRALSTDPSMSWAARRWIKFIGQYARGTLRQWQEPAAQAPKAPGVTAASGAGS